MLGRGGGALYEFDLLLSLISVKTFDVTAVLLLTTVASYKVLHRVLDSDWLKLVSQWLPFKELNLLQMSEYCAINEKSEIFSRIGQKLWKMR